MTTKIAQYLLVLTILAAAAFASAADPFYENLLFKGTAAYRTGQPARAAETLRLACFGFLDEPENLAGCLVHLALAQDGAGQQKEFTDTFHRILEVEQRFGAYTDADLSDEMRAKFQEVTKKNIPEPVLAEAKLFVQKNKE